MKNIHWTRSAFTLVELLVVVSIIVVLISLLLPAMEGAFEESRKATCGSNLHSIQLGIVQYALNSNGYIIPCEGRTSQVAFKPPEVEQLALAGLMPSGKTEVQPGYVNFDPPKFWDCPSRGYRSQWEPQIFDYHLIIGYQYFGGIEYWSNPVHGMNKLESKSPVRQQDSRPSWVLGADAIMKIEGKWGDGRFPAFAGMPSHHKADLKPVGGNHVHMDGSVAWIPFDKMLFIHSWWWPTRYAFFYQSDLPASNFNPAMDYWNP